MSDTSMHDSRSLLLLLLAVCACSRQPPARLVSGAAPEERIELRFAFWLVGLGGRAAGGGVVLLTAAGVAEPVGSCWAGTLPALLRGSSTVRPDGRCVVSSRTRGCGTGPLSLLEPGSSVRVLESRNKQTSSCSI